MSLCHEVCRARFVEVQPFKIGFYIRSHIRFAHKLEFGEKTHEVSMTALRLVSRMKKVSMADVRVSPS